METDTYYHNLIACDSFDELFRIWKSKSPQEIKYDDKVMIIIDHQKNGFISDGIVNMIQWGDGDNKKILFVLKEAYGENQEWDLAEWLRDFKDAKCVYIYDKEDRGPWDAVIENWDSFK